MQIRYVLFLCFDLIKRCVYYISDSIINTGNTSYLMFNKVLILLMGNKCNNSGGQS